MKRCPTCNRTFTDETLSFCLDDGSPLLDASGAAGPQSYGPNIKPPQSMGNAPAPTIAYRPDTIPAPQPTPSWQPGGQQQQYAPPPPRKRRVWPWVVGILGLLGVLFIGFIVLIAALASMGANANNANSTRANSNYSANRSGNRNSSNSNSNSYSQNASNSDPDTSSKTYSQSDVQITSLNMARDNGKGEPGEETDTFSPSDRTVYCVVHLSKLKAGTKVKFAWYIVNAGGMENKLIRELPYNTGAFENIVNAHLTLPQDWPTGDYRVDVSVDDGPVRSLEYSVE